MSNWHLGGEWEEVSSNNLAPILSGLVRALNERLSYLETPVNFLGKTYPEPADFAGISGAALHGVISLLIEKTRGLVERGNNNNTHFKQGPTLESPAWGISNAFSGETPTRLNLYEVTGEPTLPSYPRNANYLISLKEIFDRLIYINAPTRADTALSPELIASFTRSGGTSGSWLGTFDEAWAELGEFADSGVGTFGNMTDTDFMLGFKKTGSLRDYDNLLSHHVACFMRYREQLEVYNIRVQQNSLSTLTNVTAFPPNQTFGISDFLNFDPPPLVSESPQTGSTLYTYAEEEGYTPTIELYNVILSLVGHVTDQPA